VAFELQAVLADVLDIVDHLVAILGGDVGLGRVHGTGSVCSLAVRRRKQLFPRIVVRTETARLIFADLSDLDLLELLVRAKVFRRPLPLHAQLDLDLVAGRRGKVHGFVVLFVIGDLNFFEFGRGLSVHSANKPVHVNEDTVGFTLTFSGSLAVL
jgi:hypothetical protein